MRLAAVDVQPGDEQAAAIVVRATSFVSLKRSLLSSAQPKPSMMPLPNAVRAPVALKFLDMRALLCSVAARRSSRRESQTVEVPISL